MPNANTPDPSELNPSRFKRGKPDPARRILGLLNGAVNSRLPRDKAVLLRYLAKLIPDHSDRLKDLAEYYDPTDEA